MSEEISREEIAALLARGSEEIQREQARDTLRNAAWLGTDDDRERIERAVELLCGEPCEETISRQEVLDLAVKIELPDSQTFFCISPEDVEALPLVTPKQKIGKWIIHMEKWPTLWYRCSICSGEEERTSNYCPNCGAKMVEPQESEG